MLSIYQQILGADFNRLGKNLQQGHSLCPGLKATGKIDVEWSKLFFVRWVNQLGGLPPEGKNQKFELEIKRDENSETWTRNFTNGTFTTFQYLKNGLFYEKERVVTIAFRLKPNGHNFEYEQVKMYFAGIPIPEFMSIKSQALIKETISGWEASIQVSAPLLGVILKYNAQVNL